MGERTVVQDCFYEDYEKDLPFVYREEGPVLISAPHAIQTIKNGKEKGREYLTAAIANYVARETASSLIYACSTQPDPNSTREEDSRYKQQIRKMVAASGIKFIIDIHGMKDVESVDICLSTNGYKNVDKKIVDRFKRQLSKHFRVKVDYPFKAERKDVISAWVRKEFTIDALQIKISDELRDEHSQKVVDLINDLIAVIRSL